MSSADLEQMTQSPAPREFLAYRLKLHSIIRSNKMGVLFDANEWWERQHEQKTSSAAFRLGTSDRLQRQFLSIWELFDEAIEFDECRKFLADKAKKIRQSTPFTTIVTCTSTAKYILELLHADLETDLERVQVVYLPIHPFLSADRKALISFEGQKVLVFTDVVASGSLVSHMSSIVSELGGNVVGVLTIALVGEQLIAKVGKDETHVDFSWTPVGPSEQLKKRSLRIHFLTDFAIRKLEPDEYNPHQVIPIDPYSVYPEEATFRLNGVPTAFSLAEMYHQWERSDAIAFNFFESDGSRFLTGLRIPKLLETYGDEIWARISNWFPVDLEAHDSNEMPPPRVRLVCTFKAGDIRFKEFVERRLNMMGREVETAYLHRRHATETADYFFVPESTREQIEDQQVVLLLSAASSSQTLREIVSILASCSVRSLAVVALVNRMGPGTCDFIDRIRLIFRGQRDSEKHRASNSDLRATDDHADFQFNAVYSLNDIPSLEIGRIQDTLTTLFDHYEGSTRVPSFRSATQQIRKYFWSQPVTTREFAQGNVEQNQRYKLKVPSGHRQETVDVFSHEGKFSLLCHAIVTIEDFDSLIEQVVELKDRKWLNRLFALCLLDLSHLRLTGKIEKLRQSILDRIDREREQRFAIERSGSRTSELRSIIGVSLEIETTLIFGLAILCYMDYRHQDHMFIAVQSLTGGKTPGEWFKTPRNLLQHLADDRVAWTVSMQLLLAPQAGLSGSRFHPMIEAARTFQKFLEDNPSVDQYISWDTGVVASDLIHSTTNGVKREIGGLIRQAKDNLDMLLTDCRFYEVGTPVSCLRYLHSQLISTRQRHSPLATSLNAVCAALDDAIRSAIDCEEVSGAKIGVEQPLRCAASQLQEKIEEAIHTVGILEQIAENAHFLFRFTPTSPNDAARYTDRTLKTSFQGEIWTLRDLLLDVRRTNSVSLSMVSKITKLCSNVLRDLYDEHDSLLRKTLIRYIVPLEDMFINAIDHATERFQSSGKNRSNNDKRRPGLRYQRVWHHVRKRIMAESDVKHAVLFDPSILREVCRNLALNIRHTVKGLGLRERDYAKLVEVKIQTDRGETRDADWDFVILEIRCRGNSLDRTKLTGSTFEHHQHQVSQFGGELTIDSMNDGDGVVTSLRLISRQHQRSILESGRET